MVDESNEKIRNTVREGYAEIAKGKSGCCSGSSACCGSLSPDKHAQAIGYENDELKLVPEGANMGLSCGNPTALADLTPGQVVLDLGSGGGFDVFIAAKKVAPTGRAIGVDMTPQMLTKARESISVFTQKTGLRNVEFRLGEIEHLPIADNSVDVVISNCVINLAPDKQQVWNEIARVLKPSGKICVSDLALKEPLPQELLTSAAALVHCVGGAVLIDETIRMATQAGLINIQIDEKSYDIDVMSDCSDPLYRQVKEFLPAGRKLSEYVVSINVTAAKTSQEILTAKYKELIAIGASVACNCHPCVKFHTDKAKQMSIDEKEIKHAFDVGKMVRKGAAQQMDSLLADM